ncbi:hypothetical protein IKZ70_05895 [bacterium]|nr:hypothetical protein [bacterium]
MKWLHNLLKGLSLTTALFIFQACYGTPEWLHDNNLPFKVVAADTGEPLEGARISSRVQAADNLDWIPCGVTNEYGEALVFFGTMDGADPQFRIWAPGTEYLVKDTVLTDLRYHDVVISLTKAE